MKPRSFRGDGAEIHDSVSGEPPTPPKDEIAELDTLLIPYHHGKCPAIYIQRETHKLGECRCRLRGIKKLILSLKENWQAEAQHIELANALLDLVKQDVTELEITTDNGVVVKVSFEARLSTPKPQKEESSND